MSALHSAAENALYGAAKTKQQVAGDMEALAPVLNGAIRTVLTSAATAWREHADRCTDVVHAAQLRTAARVAEDTAADLHVEDITHTASRKAWTRTHPEVTQ